jgi:hypothetical protein
MPAREAFPVDLTFYAVTHPEGGWVTVNGCELAHLTLCKAEAIELADQVHGRVIEMNYGQISEREVHPSPPAPLPRKEKLAILQRLLQKP